MRKVIFAALILAAPRIASACNTIDGDGKEAGAFGDAVSRTAEDSK